jgi:hypothetical protein
MDDRKREVIDELQRVARLLNSKSLTMQQFAKNGKLSLSKVKNRFGSWNKAIEAAGLTPILTPATRRTICSIR